MVLRLFYNIFWTIYSPGFHNITLSSWQVSHLHFKFASITNFKYFTKDHKSWSNIWLNFFSTSNIYYLLFNSSFDGRDFLGPRGPLVLPSVGPSVRPSVRKKNLDHLYTGIYALWIMRRLIKPTLWPHGIPWMPSWPPGTPWQPPNRPPQTHKQVSWPHLNCLTNHIHLQPRHRCRPDTPSPPSPPSPWDLETLRPRDLETFHSKVQGRSRGPF